VVAIALWVALVAVSWTTGRHPVWNAVPGNLAEAAALRDAAAIVRFVDAGADPNRLDRLRRGLLPDGITEATPLEAAAAARERELMRLLLELGATFDARLWQRTWCISDDLAVRELLAQHRPPAADAACNSGSVDR
jgi:hypothetical protein